MKKKEKKTIQQPVEYQEVEIEIEFVCPTRGKIKQKVKGKKYPYKGSPVEPKYTVDIESLEELADQEEPIP